MGLRHRFSRGPQSCVGDSMPDTSDCTDIDGRTPDGDEGNDSLSESERHRIEHRLTVLQKSHGTLSP